MNNFKIDRLSADIDLLNEEMEEKDKQITELEEYKAGELARCAEESEKQSEYEGELTDRIAELKKTLTQVRDLLNEQENKACLGTRYPENDGECAPWAIIDEVINNITKSLLAKGGDV